MTQDEIIALAKRVGVEATGNEYWPFFIEELMDFAKLVAAAERKACAQIVNDDRGLSDDDAIRVCRAIRARGQA